jgi:ABC-type phosphate transport system permease subunit
MFSDVLLRAQRDTSFFLIMFVAFTIAFSLIGNIIFGVSDFKFQDFGSSAFSLFLVAIRSINSNEIIFYSRTFTSVYGLVYLLITILLLNMFFAIIISHYIEYYTEQGYLKDSVIKLLVKSFLVDHPPQIEDKKGSTVWKRLKYKILIRLHRFAHSIRKEIKYLEEQARCKLA